MKAAAMANIRHRQGNEPITRTLNVDGVVITLMLGSFLMTAFAGLLLALLLRQSSASPTETARFAVGANILDVPVAWLRPGAPRSGGRVGRLDLALPWPDNGGSGDAAGQSSRAPSLGLDRAVLVSIVPSDGAIAPPDRPATLYSRFVTADVDSHAGGLIVRHFRSGSPYDGEDLYLSPPDGRSFSARCPSREPTSTARDTGGREINWREGCVAELRIGNLDTQLRFSAPRLASWERLADGVRRAVAGMVH
jgi:hypothetical protein